MFVDAFMSEDDFMSVGAAAPTSCAFELLQRRRFRDAFPTVDIRHVNSSSTARCLLACRIQQSHIHRPAAMTCGAEAPMSMSLFAPPTRKQCKPRLPPSL